MRVRQLVKQEIVLIVAVVLAVFSAVWVPPDRRYLAYLDFRTLAILFSLMAVMTGMRRQGVFSCLGKMLLRRCHTTRQLVLSLVGLCFFGSMAITNDVALLTFVPFTFVVLRRLDPSLYHSLVLPVISMQTIAANLGSMATPVGNPQNLYLYGQSGLTGWQFVVLMLPYSLVSLLLLAGWAILLCRTLPADLSALPRIAQPDGIVHRGLVCVYAVLFLVCLLAVARILPYELAFLLVGVGILCTRRDVLYHVDYSLLLTFIAFFLFIGNVGRIPAFSEWMAQQIAGQEVVIAVLASQCISNVPAALLLSGFTEKFMDLIVGTNLGGLGTLIASMASLISYRQIAVEMPQEKGRYFCLFTIANVVFLLVLLALWYRMK